MPSHQTRRDRPRPLEPEGAPPALPWRDVIELLPYGIALTYGATHVVEYMNARLRELTGQPRIRTSLRLVELFRDIDVATLDRVYASGVGESSADQERRLPDGTMGSLEYTFSPLRPAGGSVRGLIVSVRDTTDQVLLRRGLTQTANAVRTVNERLVVSSVREQELAEAEGNQREQLNALLERLSEGVVIADVSGRIQMMNRAARIITGVGGDDVSTVEALDRVTVHDIAGRPLRSEERPLKRALRGEEFTDYEFLCLPSPDAPVVWSQRARA